MNMFNMETSVLSVDSLGGSELELLREKLKQKDLIINEKSQIIDSLRQQVRDLVQDNEEMENDQQLLQQKMDRITRDLEEKNNDLESLSHTLKELEMAHDKLESRMEARTGQVQKLAQDLVQANKELEETKVANEKLKHQNEKLATELDLANSRKRAAQELRLEEEERQRRQQAAHHTHKFSSALRFPIADEIGEFMDSSSQLSDADGLQRACQYHLRRPSRAPATVTKQEPPARVKQERFDIDFDLEPLATAPVRQERTIVRQEPVALRQPAQACKRELSHEEEYGMRVARAQELARRNAKTKPLHQTSYALELDTFDITNFNEQEIKKGNIRPPQRLPPQPPVSHSNKQSGPARRALANCSNTPPVVKRQAYKKAEAFIV